MVPSNNMELYTAIKRRKFYPVCLTLHVLRLEKQRAARRCVLCVGLCTWRLAAHRNGTLLPAHRPAYRSDVIREEFAVTHSHVNARKRVPAKAAWRPEHAQCEQLWYLHSFADPLISSSRLSEYLPHKVTETIVSEHDPIVSEWNVVIIAELGYLRCSSISPTAFHLGNKPVGDYREGRLSKWLSA